MASPHFGERWARHWLDPARFGESHGFEHDSPRPFAYHYRDFVIRAFNRDMPYDQFVRWQLAGDELAPDDPDALAATGFLGAGVFPTQITTSEAERIRYDALDDMLATTGYTMLALTVACAAATITSSIPFRPAITTACCPPSRPRCAARSSGTSAAAGRSEEAARRA